MVTELAQVLLGHVPVAGRPVGLEVGGRPLQLEGGADRVAHLDQGPAKQDPAHRRVDPGGDLFRRGHGGARLFDGEDGVAEFRASLDRIVLHPA